MKPQQRADRLRIFREELESLERQHILDLTAEQRSRLEEHLAESLRQLADRADVDTSDEERRLSLGMRVISALGGLAFCAALALFLARYLPLWPVWLQVAVLVAAPVALLGAADLAAGRERTLYFATLLTLVAIAAFVVDLSVLGVIFNVTPTPNALAAWGLFALALAYHFGLRLPLAAALISLICWAATSSPHWRGFWWQDFPDRLEDLAAAGLAVAAASLLLRHARRVDFPAVYRLIGLLAFFFALFVLSVEGRQSYLPLESRTVERIYQTLGLVTSAGVVWLGIVRAWNEVVNIGAAFFAIYLLVRLIDWWWSWMPQYLFFLLLGVIALGLLWVFKRLRARLRRAA